MIKIEKILGVAILILLLLQWLNIPGARFLLTISLMLIILTYFFLGVIIVNQIKVKNMFKAQSYRDLSIIKIVGSIILGFMLSTVCLGILYNLQKWQGATDISIFGFVLLLLALLVVGYKYFVTKATYYLIQIKRIIIIGIMGVIIYLI